MGKGIFITGTDTGVGKTLVTAALGLLALESGKSTGVFKPIETGIKIDNGVHIPEDAHFLKTTLKSNIALELITPYSFIEPAAPYIAAREEGKTVDLQHIRSVYASLSETHDVVLVEGAGGLLVPLNKDSTNADLIQKLQIPTVLVVGSRLGALNHTFLTVTCLRNLGIEIYGIIVNNLLPKTTLALKTNTEMIKRNLPDIPFLGELAFRPTFCENIPDREEILNWVEPIKDNLLSLVNTQRAKPK